MKKVWICASVIVLLFVNTASLMMFPGVKPTSVLFAIPVVAGSATALETLTLGAETEAWAAAAGTTVPITRAETARKQVRSGWVLRVFRERGARRDM
ncbi:hypothetical protein [Microbacterium aurugineum]|uniref:hypothetical protein n=1 Tax=Microbacterium aurugineum TaxID=2851642 RepID=UPI0021C28F9A|nr:hypothetical protein [Microbacterium aurugineum]